MAVKLVKKSADAASQRSTASGASAAEKKVRLVRTRETSYAPKYYSAQPVTQAAPPNTEKPALMEDWSGEAWTRATASQTKIPEKNAASKTPAASGQRNDLYALQEQRRQAQVDMDIDAMNALDAQIKQERQRLGVPTLTQRLLSMAETAALSEASSITNKLGVDMDVRGGTAMKSVYQEQAERLQRQIDAAENLLQDASLDDAMRNEVLFSLEQDRKQLAIYQSSVRANEETGKALYETADTAASAADARRKRAQVGLGSAGKTAVNIGTGLMQLGMEGMTNAISPGLSTVVRGASIGGAASKAYRNGIDASNEAREAFGSDEKLEYDPQKARMLQGITGSGAYIGHGVSRLIGNSGLNLMRSLGVQNYVLPNIISGGAASTGYAMGETAAAEIAKALTYDNYQPNWEEIGTEAVVAFGFGAISTAARTFSTAIQNRKYIESLNLAVGERYQIVHKIMQSPGSAQDKAAAAASVMDGVDQLRQAINQLQVVGAQKEVDAINHFLNSIDAEMAQYLNIASSPAPGAASAPVAPLMPSASGGSTVSEPKNPPSGVPPVSDTALDIQPPAQPPVRANVQPPVNPQEIPQEAPSMPAPATESAKKQGVAPASDVTEETKATLEEAALQAVEKEAPQDAPSVPPAAEIGDTLSGGRRVDQPATAKEQSAASADASEQGTVGMDAASDDTDAMRTGGSDREDQWKANRVGDANKKPKSLSEIVEKIRHDFGINITTGHIRGSGKLGQYDRRTQGVRTRIANDLPVVCHELGHHLDTVYQLTNGMNAAQRSELLNGLSAEMKSQYPQRKWAREGLAEYIRKYLQNWETAAIDYPEFTKYFLNSLNGFDRGLIEQLADEVNA